MRVAPPTPISRQAISNDPQEIDPPPTNADRYADEHRPATPNTREQIFGAPLAREEPPDDTIAIRPSTSRNPFSKDKDSDETTVSRPKSHLNSLSERLRANADIADDAEITDPSTDVTPPPIEVAPPIIPPPPSGLGRVGGRRISSETPPSSPPAPNDEPMIGRKRAFSAPLPPNPTPSSPKATSDPTEATRGRFTRPESNDSPPTTPPPASGAFSRRMTTGQEDLRPRGPRSQPPSTPNQPSAQNQTIPLPIVLPDGQQIQITQQQLDQLIAEKGSYTAALEYLVTLNRRDE